MKKKFTIVLFVIAFIFRCISVNAQQYTVGIPVYDTIAKGNFYIQPSPNICISGSLWLDTNLVNRVTGVQCFLLITASTFPTDSLRKISSVLTDLGPLNLGDSILLTHNPLVATSQIFAFYYGAKTLSGTFSYAIIAEGTPTSANDSFVCPSDISSFAGTMVDACLTESQLWYLGATHNCKVTPSDVAGINTSVKPQFSFNIVPNPAQDFISIETNQPGSMVLALTDITGKTLLKQPVRNGAKVDIIGIPLGLYYYSLSINGGIQQNGKLLINR